MLGVSELTEQIFRILECKQTFTTMGKMLDQMSKAFEGSTAKVMEENARYGLPVIVAKKGTDEVHKIYHPSLKQKKSQKEELSF